MTVATQPERTQEILELIGDPRRVIEEIQQAQESGKTLSSEQPHLIDEYAEKWVALHDGKVVAAAEAFDDLLKAVDPATRTHVLVRFIARSEQRMIL